MYNQYGDTKINSNENQEFITKMGENISAELNIVEKLIDQDYSEQKEIIFSLINTILKMIQQLEEKYQDNNILRSMCTLLRNKADMEISRINQ